MQPTAHLSAIRVCPACGQENISERNICKRCRAQLPPRVRSLWQEPATGETLQIYTAPAPPSPPREPPANVLAIAAVFGLVAAVALLAREPILALAVGGFAWWVGHQPAPPRQPLQPTLTMSRQGLEYVSDGCHVQALWVHVLSVDEGRGAITLAAQAHWLRGGGRGSAQELPLDAFAPHVRAEILRAARLRLAGLP